jgi:hypothetical protein
MKTSKYLERIDQRNAHAVQLGEDLKRERDANILKAAIDSGKLIIVDCRTPREKS